MKQKTDFEKWINPDKYEHWHWIGSHFLPDIHKADFSILSDRELLKLLTKFDGDEDTRVMESEDDGYRIARIKQWFADWKKKRGGKNEQQT